MVLFILYVCLVLILHFFSWSFILISQWVSQVLPKQSRLKCWPAACHGDVPGIPYLVLKFLIKHLSSFCFYQILSKLYIYKFIRHYYIFFFLMFIIYPLLFMFQSISAYTWMCVLSALNNTNIVVHLRCLLPLTMLSALYRLCLLTCLLHQIIKPF